MSSSSSSSSSLSLFSSFFFIFLLVFGRKWRVTLGAIRLACARPVLVLLTISAATVAEHVRELKLELRDGKAMRLSCEFPEQWPLLLSSSASGEPVPQQQQPAQAQAKVRRPAFQELPRQERKSCFVFFSLPFFFFHYCFRQLSSLPFVCIFNSLLLVLTEGGAGCFWRPWPCSRLLRRCAESSSSRSSSLLPVFLPAYRRPLAPSKRRRTLSASLAHALLQIHDAVCGSGSRGASGRWRRAGTAVQPNHLGRAR